jgi:hypothetical protein
VSDIRRAQSSNTNPLECSSQVVSKIPTIWDIWKGIPLLRQNSPRLAGNSPSSAWEILHGRNPCGRVHGKLPVDPLHDFLEFTLQ